MIALTPADFDALYPPSLLQNLVHPRIQVEDESALPAAIQAEKERAIKTGTDRAEARLLAGFDAAELPESAMEASPELKRLCATLAYVALHAGFDQAAESVTEIERAALDDLDRMAEHRLPVRDKTVAGAQSPPMMISTRKPQHPSGLPILSIDQIVEDGW